jgi:hypothetical protein
MMHLDINPSTRWWEAQITAYRFQLENERVERRKLMAIEIKGLKAKAIKAGTVFERLNRAYDKLIETGDAHAGDVESLAPQLAAMQDDISFAVATLGNSVNGSLQTAWRWGRTLTSRRSILPMVRRPGRSYPNPFAPQRLPAMPRSEPMRCRRCGNTDPAKFEKHGLGGWRCVPCGRVRMEGAA